MEPKKARFGLRRNLYNPYLHNFRQKLPQFRVSSLFFQPGREETHPFRLSRGELCRKAARNTPPPHSPQSSGGESLTEMATSPGEDLQVGMDTDRPTDPL